MRRLVSTVSEAPRKNAGASASRSARAVSRSLNGVSGSSVKSRPLRVPLIAIYPCIDCLASFTIPRSPPASELSFSELSCIRKLSYRLFFQKVRKQGKVDETIHLRDMARSGSAPQLDTVTVYAPPS